MKCEIRFNGFLKVEKGTKKQKTNPLMLSIGFFTNPTHLQLKSLVFGLIMYTINAVAKPRHTHSE